MQLCFADREFESPYGFQAEHAKQIINYVFEVLPKVDCLLVHCEAGTSRSPAIAAGISNILYGEDNIYFENYNPNLLVYKKLIQEY